MIYGISDLHLDHTGEKSMEVFGSGWENYQNRIFENWMRLVKKDDLVLVPGDISWAMKLDDAYIDLKRIDDLPGIKVMLKGNHDYWWTSLSKLNKLNLTSIYFLQNDCFQYQDVTIAGTRGWDPRDAADFTDKDENIFRRELIRLNLSLESMGSIRKSICMFHYPPFNRDGSPNEFADAIKEYGIKNCVYGHLHGQGLANVIEGEVEGINYKCLSADYLKFVPYPLNF